MMRIILMTDFHPILMLKVEVCVTNKNKKPPQASPEWLFFHAFLGWSTIYLNRRQVQDSAGYYYLPPCLLIQLP